jgi:hypothetical protein
MEITPAILIEKFEDGLGMAGRIVCGNPEEDYKKSTHRN